MDPEVEPEFGNQKVSAGRLFGGPFGATWAILGAILGPAAIPEGFPNHIFFASNLEKSEKMEAQKRYPKNLFLVLIFH